MLSLSFSLREQCPEPLFQLSDTTFSRILGPQRSSLLTRVGSLFPSRQLSTCSSHVLPCPILLELTFSFILQLLGIEGESSLFRAELDRRAVLISSSPSLSLRSWSPNRASFSTMESTTSASKVGPWFATCLPIVVELTSSSLLLLSRANERVRFPPFASQLQFVSSLRHPHHVIICSD